MLVVKPPAKSSTPDQTKAMSVSRKRTGEKRAVCSVESVIQKGMIRLVGWEVKEQAFRETTLGDYWVRGNGRELVFEKLRAQMVLLSQELPARVSG